VLRHAESWRLEAGFRDWLEERNVFLDTLVDRIVPGYPKEEAERIFGELGYEDKLLTTGEPFHLWVIQGPASLATELPFDQIGLNVIWTDDLAPYRTRKVRLLNGGHTSSVLAAYLAGCETVGEMMDDELTAEFLRRAVFDEILPTLRTDAAPTRDFAQSVFERFRNPFIRHRLLDVALNSISKWRVRVLPSLADYLEMKRQLPRALTFSLAALLRFYRPARVEGEEYWGERDDGESYPIRDDASALAFIANGWQRLKDGANREDMVGAILANAGLWGGDLAQIPGLTAAVVCTLRAICERGVRPALRATL